MSDCTLYAEFHKIDAEAREVYGYATTPTLDQAGETVSLEAVKNALPKYMQYPAVREMHQPSAVGTGIEANLDDRGLWFGAKVIDDQAWRKVQGKVYRGFSIGGRVTKRDPKDPKHILDIDLVEISLVDRPCNPDARFELIKRDGAGNLTMSEGFEKAGRVMSGRFASLKQLHGEAKGQQKKHEVLADDADKDADRHSRKTEGAIDAKDKEAVQLHAQMAHTSRSVANHHRDIASRYEHIANSLVPEGSEDDMPEEDFKKLIQKATDQMDDLTKSITGADGSGSGKNPDIKTASAELEHGQQMDAKSIAEIATATRAKANANASKASDGDKAKHQSSEAAASMTSAHAAAIKASDSYKSFAERIGTSLSHDAGVGRGTEPMNVEGTKLKEHNLSKSEVLVVLNKRKAHFAALRKAADEFIGMVKTSENQDEEEKEMLDTAQRIKKVADEDEKLTTKLGGEIENMKDLAGTENSSSGEVVKKSVKTSRKLIKVGNMWLDKSGTFFGKRDFSDDKRQELADKGHAMPDGSFPIENKEDLHNAIGLRGNSKHSKQKVESHIRTQAKRLGVDVSDQLGKADSAEDKEDKAIGLLQDAQAKERKEGTDDDDKTAAAKAKPFGGKQAKPFGQKDEDDDDDEAEDDAADKTDKSEDLEKRACLKCGGMNKAGDMKCAACGASMEKAAKPKKEMKCAAVLADALKSVQRLTKSGRLPNTPDLAKWLADGNKLLQAALADKITAMMKGPEIPVTTFAKAATSSGWMKTASGALLVLGDGLSPVERDTRIGLSKHFRRMRKEVERMTREEALERKQKTIAKVQTRLAKSAPPEASTQVRTLVERMTPLVKSAQEMRTRLDAKDNELAGLKDRLAKLESQPADNGGKRDDLRKFKVVGKTEDGKVIQGTLSKQEESDPKFAAILDIPAGKERAEFLLRQAYTSK